MAKPKAPTGTKAVYTSSSRTVMVTWAAASGATSYRVDRWNGTTQLYSQVTTTSSTYYIDSSLTDAEQYAYRVQALNADGGSNFGVPSPKITIINPPAAVTEVTAVWNTNGSVTLAWKNNPTTLAPYLYHYLRRWDSVGKAWAQYNRIAGSAVSNIDATAIPDRQLQYRVHTSNGAGGGYYMSAIAVVYTAPKAPTGLSARWVGDDIIVSWVNPSTIATGFTLSHEGEGGGGFEVVANLGKVVSWRHVDPERGIDHRYRVVALAPTPTTGPRAYSATVTSGWLPAQTNPDPPTILGPAYVPAGEASVMQYRHNPLSPDSPEGGVRLQWRRGSGGWTVVNLATLPSQTAGITEVQMATKTPSSGWSDWSASASITVRNRPSVALTSPTGGAVITGPLLPVKWTIPGQSAWEVELLKSGVLVEAQSGRSERAASVTVEDASSYTVRLRVHDGYLWSTWQTAAVTTAFVAPSVATLTVVPDGESLAVTASAALPAGADWMILMRRRTGPEWVSDPWHPVGEFVDGQAVDLLAPLCGLEYVAVAYAHTGAAATSEPVTTEIPTKAFAVNYGPGLGAVAWVARGVPVLVPQERERERALHQFAGRRLPVEVLGQRMSRRVSASGVAIEGSGSARSKWDAVLASDERWFRDPTGSSFRASISSLQVAMGAAVTTVTFTAEEVA